jgi:hypothetical protein
VREHDRILQGLAGALPQVERRRVDGVAQQADAAPIVEIIEVVVEKGQLAGRMVLGKNGQVRAARGPVARVIALDRDVPADEGRVSSFRRFRCQIAREAERDESGTCSRRRHRAGDGRSGKDMVRAILYAGLRDRIDAPLP